MSTGLTLGKFAPLHRGHQDLIETALDEVDRLVVMVYDAPDTTNIPLTTRANWIRSLYPRVQVIEAWDGPTGTGTAPAITRMHDDYIRAATRGETITHFYSAEFYGDHVSRALGAIDRRLERNTEISATRIRADSYRNRHFLDPIVYRDLIARIVFMGAPSTGKSSLAAGLARHYNTVWMPEYGRSYWMEHQQDRRLSPEQLVEIAEGHIEREEKLFPDANRFLFVDTEAIITWHFALDYHGAAHPRLEQLADRSPRRYDLYFLCDDDIPFDDTWERSGETHRGIFQKRLRADLLARGIPFVTLNGTLARRIRKATALLDHFDRYASLADQLAADLVTLRNGPVES